MKYIYQNLMRVISQLLMLCGLFLVFANIWGFVGHSALAILALPFYGLPGLLLWWVGKRVQKRLKAKQAKSFGEACQERIDEIQSGVPAPAPVVMPSAEPEAPLYTASEIIFMGAVLMIFIGAPWTFFSLGLLKDTTVAYGVLAFAVGIALYKWAGWMGRLLPVNAETPPPPATVIETCTACAALRICGGAIILAALVMGLIVLFDDGRLKVVLIPMLFAVLAAAPFFAAAHFLQKARARKRKKPSEA